MTTNTTPANDSLQNILVELAKGNKNLVETTLYFVGATPEEAMNTQEFDSWGEADSYRKDQEDEQFIFMAKSFINFETLQKM